MKSSEMDVEIFVDLLLWFVNVQKD